MTKFIAMEKELSRLNALYSTISTKYYLIRKYTGQKEVLAKKVNLLTNGMEHDKKIVLQLKKANKRLSGELNTVAGEYGEIEHSMRAAEKLVRIIGKMDGLKGALREIHRTNASVRVQTITRSEKIEVLREGFSDLKKDRDRVGIEHADLMEARNNVIALHSKTLPRAKVIDLKERLAKELEGSQKKSQENDRLKGELARIIPAKESLEEERATAKQKLSLTGERARGMKEKIERIAPKVISDQEVKKLEQEVEAMRASKEQLAGEKKIISSKLASITGEEEQLTSMIEAYRVKNRKDGERATALKKELKGLDADRGTIDSMREKAAAKEQELEVNRKELETTRQEHTEVRNANQQYKTVIEEVEKGAQKLKKAVRKRKI